MAKKKIQESEAEEVKELDVVQPELDSVDPTEYEDAGESIDIPGEAYSGIAESSVILDQSTGTVIDESKLSPFERIKLTTRKLGKEINDPDKKCKHCYGRGYTNVDIDGTPTPCKCLFKDWYAQNPHYKNVAMPSFNRKYRRAAEKHQKAKPVVNTALVKRKQKLLEYMKKSIMQTPEYREIVEAQLAARAAEAEQAKMLAQMAETPEAEAEIVPEVEMETAERID